MIELSKRYRAQGSPSSALSIDSRQAASWLLGLSMSLAAIAIGLHFPGHVSMDTSVQLYEAHTGKSLSWNPPFMSALMQWLGGGERATGLMVVMSSLATYLSFGCLAANNLRQRATLGLPVIGLWRVALCGLMILNPVILIYVGIVWKDVLFATLMTVGLVLSFTAANATFSRSLPLAIAAAVILALSMQVRQQGVFMAPILLLCTIIGTVSYRNLPGTTRALISGILIAVFVAALFVSKALVAQSIAGASNKSQSTGIEAILLYDMAGMVARSKAPTDKLPVPIAQDQRDAVGRAYSSERIDYLLSDSTALQWLYTGPVEQRKQMLLALMRREPAVFVEHKWEAYKRLLNINGLQGCLPLHVGVVGNVDYLKAVGIENITDKRDRIAQRMGGAFFSWPIYRHWFYLVALLGGVVVVALVRLPARVKSMCSVVSFASGAFYLSYLPTSIACDFRYLYTGICLVTLLWIVLVTASLFQSVTRAAPFQRADGGGLARTH